MTTRTIQPGTIRHQLAQHHGSETFTTMGPLFAGILMTEGVVHMAELCCAHWLPEAIASHIVTDRKLRREEFQVWTLAKLEGGTWRLLATDGNDNGIALQEIEYSDFPLDDEPFALWACYNGQGFTIMLPSEY